MSKQRKSKKKKKGKAEAPIAKKGSGSEIESHKLTIPCKDIEFGYASAEVESAESPKLLLDAFLDPENVVKDTLEGKCFLILGPKGSGKSAVGLHLALDAQRHSNYFVNTYFLSDLSYNTLGAIVHDAIEPELRFQRAWSLILLTLLNSVSKDQGAQFQDTVAFIDTVKANTANLLLT